MDDSAARLNRSHYSPCGGTTLTFYSDEKVIPNSPRYVDVPIVRAITGL